MFTGCVSFWWLDYLSPRCYPKHLVCKVSAPLSYWPHFHLCTYTRHSFIYVCACVCFASLAEVHIMYSTSIHLLHLHLRTHICHWFIHTMLYSICVSVCPVSSWGDQSVLLCFCCTKGKGVCGHITPGTVQYWNVLNKISRHLILHLLASSNCSTKYWIDKGNRSILMVVW